MPTLLSHHSPCLHTHKTLAEKLRHHSIYIGLWRRGGVLLQQFRRKETTWET